MGLGVGVFTALWRLPWGAAWINPVFPLQTAYQTELGQMLDLITAPVSQVDLNRFTEQR